MKTSTLSLLGFVCAALFVAVSPSRGQGTAFTYQGQLSTGTNPVTGHYDMTFSLFATNSGGSAVAGPVNTNGVNVFDGLFTVTVDFGPGVFTGPSYWLQVGVKTNGGLTFTNLAPRQQLTPAPYAVFAEGANAAATVGGLGPNNFWKTTGNGGTTAGVNFLGTTDNQPLELHVAGTRGLRLEPDPAGFGEVNVIGGSANNSIGANDSGDFIGGGYGNSHGANESDSTIGGGFENAVLGSSSTLGGGANNTVGLGAQAATIGGGQYNTNNGQYATIPGGYNNLAAGPFSFAAGRNAQALNDGSFVWADDSGGTLADTGANQFVVRAQGGAYFYDDLRLNNNRLLLTSGSDTNNGLGFGTGSLPGINGDSGPFLFGYVGGALGAILPNTVCLSWDYSGNVWVSNNCSVASLNVRGATATDSLTVNGSGYLTANSEFFVVPGLTPVQCYIGDDGSGNDVQIGSLRSGITAVACYNAADNAYMHLYCSSITIEGGADLAEPFTISSGANEVPQGAVVVIDDQNPGHLKLSDQAYDTRVAGVVSGANGINPGIQMQQQGLLEGGKNVALTGRVYVLADTANGAIRPGDLLTTSSRPGYAMKVTDHAKAQGAILGKAMTGLSDSKGMVLVLVTLQ